MSTIEPPFQGSKVLILDFGSQYTQVIARRVRECSVYSQIMRFDAPVAELQAAGARGIILSGGPSSVYAENAPQPDLGLFDLGLPVLGICYGEQLMFHHLGGGVEPSPKREYGAGVLNIEAADCPLFAGAAAEARRLEQPRRQGDQTAAGFPDGGAHGELAVCGGGRPGPAVLRVAVPSRGGPHPARRDLLQNFLYNICGCSPDWTMGSFIDQTCGEIRAKVGSERVILGLSAGWILRWRQCCCTRPSGTS